MGDTQVVGLLARMFPSFKGIPLEEANRRAEALGLFAARAWVAGPDGMAARGVPISPDAHARSAGAAGQVAQTGANGVPFLAHLRGNVGDDAQFAQVMAGLAKVYAASLRGAPAAAPAPQPAPSPAPAPDPDFGSLDLLPEQETTTRTYEPLGFADEPPQSAPPPRQPAPKPAAPPDAGLDLAPEDDAGSGRRMSAEELLYAEPTGEESALEDDGTMPQDPADRAFWSYERTGDEGFLAQAEQVLTQQQAAAPHPLAAAVAIAGLARVALLRGDGAQALAQAKAALTKHPSNPYAVEILVRAERGEADQAVFRRLLRQLKFALEQRHVARIQELAVTMAKQYPQEPFPYLAMVFVAKLQGDDKAFQQHLKRAWTNYPSEAHADRSFGGEVDPDLCDVLVFWGRTPYKHMDEDGLRQTIEDVDSKDNLIAGALRMAVGLGKVALTQPGVSRALQRRLHFVVGRGMMGLQYFEAAPDEMGKALMLGPTPDEHKSIGNERLQCQALWRAFDKPGISAQNKRFVCLGSSGMAGTIRRRLEGMRNDRSQREQEVFSQGPVLWERARKDRAMQTEIASACEVSSIPNPISVLEEVEEELELLAVEQATIAAPQPKPLAEQKKSGLFGKLKAAASSAASSVGSAAKGAQLKVKHGQLTQKRENAIRKLAVVLAREIEDFDFTHPVLVGYARRAAMLEAFLDFFQAEEQRCQDALNALAFSK